jgi:cobyrinic acid a,c-diamide synthase
MEVPRIVIAGNASGAGKTTVALGLMAAMRRRGLRVQPFKVGPDYIDPAYHVHAAGRPSRNIDGWLFGRQPMSELVAHACGSADLAVIEGIMGLYDGRSGLGAEGSTAEIARWLRAPVLLVLDVSRVAQSAGAIALGYQEFDHEVQIIGVVLNNVANATHLARATEAVETGAGLPVFGHLMHNPAITLPEAHPSLVPDTVRAGLLERIDRTRADVESAVDIEALLKAARSAWPLPTNGGKGLFPISSPAARARIAVFSDAAFDLYHPDNLDLLRAWGAELVPVSPLNDAELPSDLDGIYAGPGFPEIHAAQLAENVSFLQSLRAAVRAGVPVYGESGGLAYLSLGIVTPDGRRHPLAGIAPAWSELGDAGVRLGYTLAIANRSSLIARRGKRLRGYEFYWSDRQMPAEVAAYRIVEPEEKMEGYASESVLASRVRLHFGSDQSLARNLVDRCVRRAEARA